VVLAAAGRSLSMTGRLAVRVRKQRIGRTGSAYRIFPPPKTRQPSMFSVHPVATAVPVAAYSRTVVAIAVHRRSPSTIAMAVTVVLCRQFTSSQDQPVRHGNCINFTPCLRRPLLRSDRPATISYLFHAIVHLFSFCFINF